MRHTEKRLQDLEFNQFLVILAMAILEEAEGPKHHGRWMICKWEVKMYRQT